MYLVNVSHNETNEVVRAIKTASIRKAEKIAREIEINLNENYSIQIVLEKDYANKNR